MARPDTAFSTLNPVVAGSMREFDLTANQRGFIGLNVLPAFMTPKASGEFGIIPLESLLQKSGITKRASRAGYPRGNWKPEEATFETSEYGWEEPVDDKELALYEDYFDALVLAGDRAQHIVVEDFEKVVADTMFDTGTYTKTDVTNEWDDASNATPIADVEAAVQRIYAATGVWSDTLVMGNKVFRNLRFCDDIKDAIAASGAGDPTKAMDITLNMLRQVFDIPKIFVGGGVKNTADDGQSATIGDIWDDEYVGVGKTVNNPRDIRDLGVGRTFVWSADGGGGAMDPIVETYREEQTRSDIVRVRHQLGVKVIYPELWQLLGNITS